MSRTTRRSRSSSDGSEARGPAPLTPPEGHTHGTPTHHQCRPHRRRPDRHVARRDHRPPRSRRLLVAVADPRPGVAEALGSSLGARGVLAPEDIFGADDIDAVVITASSDAHCELVVGAAAAGKAVFCEKPMSMTLSDAERAVAAARDAGVPLQVGFNRRFAADFAAAHAAIVDGRHRDTAADALGDPRPGTGRPRRRTAVDGVHPDADPRLRRAAVVEPRRVAGRGLRDRRCPGRAGVQGRPACSTRPSS